MKALFFLPALVPVLLCSCTPGEYHPEYLNEASALDAPGMGAAREAQRNRLVQEGAYAPGEELEVQEGKVYLFNRNPDTNEHATGRMVTCEKATIISCEGLYYFVKLDEGSKGFLRESDLVNPVKLVSTLPEGETPGPEGWVDGTSQPDTLQLDADQTLMTNAAGRTVVVVSKKSEGNSEFQQRKEALQQGHELPAAPLPDPASEPLPEPAGSGR